MKNVKENNDKKSNYFYIGLIVLIWLITYLVCQVLFDQKLGWDEVAYMSVAKGITENFDFSARAYTVMGILKHGYPTHLINFPIYPIYLAIFFKLFGCSLKIAYFSTWLSALGVCILIYYIFLLISEDNKKLAFLVSMSYLFSPGIIKNCDSALMEQTGCLLLCLAVYFILKDYVSGNFNHFTILKFSFSFLILWIYKSLFIGFFFGAFVFICLAYNSKISGKKLNTKIPLFLFLTLSYGIFAVLFCILAKFVFLPVAPMMTFADIQGAQQLYADFLGGAFVNFPENLIKNMKDFFTIIVSPYFIYPTYYSKYAPSLLLSTSNIILVGVYFFILLIVSTLTLASWKKLSPQAKLFVSLTLGTILTFNFIFNFLFTTTFGNIWRYNLYSLPLYLCTLGIVLKTNYEYLKPFVFDHPRAGSTIFILFFVLGYIPLYLSTIKQYLFMEDAYHTTAKNNSKIVDTFVQNENPQFIYFSDGIHSTFLRYPMKQVMKEATNEQLEQINKILPKSIEYLFLRPSDWLFQNNQDLILKGAPIINEQYKYLGFDKDAQIVVYKLNQ